MKHRRHPVPATQAPETQPETAKSQDINEQLEFLPSKPTPVDDGPDFGM